MKWTSQTTYVDIETGEIIIKHRINNYSIIKKQKHAKINRETNEGHITWTITVRRNAKQGRIFE